MKKLQRVVWSKGMFLLPQHFQAQDDYFEDLLQFRFAASNFAAWGIASIGVDEPALANGSFTLRSCSGIMPDGLAFDMPGADRLPSARAIKENFPPSQENLDVYLALPERQTDGRNVSLTANGDTRYTAETANLSDATLGAEDKPIQVAAKTFRIVLGGESLEGLTALRIAQVGRKTTGAYILTPAFIAPCIDIASSDFLMNLVRRQIEILAARSATLTGSRRQKSREAADYTSAEAADFWLFHTISSCLPEIRHIWKVRRGHPDILYRAMLRLAGGLSTFAMDAQREFPDYDHNNLGFCFTQLDDRIRDLVEAALPSKCIAIPFTPVDKLIWSARIPDDQFLKDSQFLLSVSSRASVEDLISKFPRLARVSSPAEINRLIRNALPGVPLRFVTSPPPAVPFRLEKQYFNIDSSDALWEGVAQSRTVAAFVPGEISDPVMELLIVLR